MRNFALVLVFVALTFLSWGMYGPVLHIGQLGMEHTRLRPFICVGLAYFLIAVIVPMIALMRGGEKGSWSVTGTIWSLAAGAAGAIGALGIILAFANRGNPVYVMPLVFGCAPVVNTMLTTWMTKTFKDINPVFLAGIILVAVGAAGVLFFKPTTKTVKIKETDSQVQVEQTKIKDGEPTTRSWTATTVEGLKEIDGGTPYDLYQHHKGPTFVQFIFVILSVALTALCWGSYGPVLHKGQMKMNGSRMRPFMCVGLAYFAIAVVVPFLLIGVGVEADKTYWTWSGTIWSLLAGTAGAVGALGIIMAFNFEGKPILVMPLVFGGAPVVNTFFSVASAGSFAMLSVPFAVSLVLVIIGAATVLIFSPKPAKKQEHVAGKKTLDKP